MEVIACMQEKCLRLVVESKNYRASDRVFLIVRVFNDRSIEYKRIDLLIKVHRRYSKVVCSVTGGEAQRALAEEAMEMLDKRVPSLKQMIVVNFVEHCNLGFTHSINIYLAA